MWTNAQRDGHPGEYSSVTTVTTTNIVLSSSGLSTFLLRLKKSL